MKDFNKYTFNILKSPVDNRDFLLESIYPEQVELPKTWDMRPMLPPVKDQGRQGTCSAQTAACMKEYQERLDVGLSEALSPQFVYNLRQNQTSAGMIPRDTMDILNKIGIVKETEYPYNSKTKITTAMKKIALKYIISGYAQIGTIDSLKKALFANGPCYIAFPVYNGNNLEFWKQEFPNQPSMGGHAVSVVGYTEDAFIIRNSWSAAWGEGGYTFYKFTDWGRHWECWTTLDADSNPVGLQRKLALSHATRKEKVGFFRRMFGGKVKECSCKK